MPTANAADVVNQGSAWILFRTSNAAKHTAPIFMIILFWFWKISTTFRSAPALRPHVVILKLAFKYPH
jgi:hypothetical protein